eukprot:c11534_g1_i2.p1 GENE.c11534_g1_i2~~c11534_g1_i2.p1  ORF type:complete len:191 (-),score=39.91 c11534_g1_i2:489-989(-)
MNKPDGQYVLANTREAVEQFITNMSVRKVPGIGAVTEKLLEALGISTCGDLLTELPKLYELFSETTFNSFVRACTGVGGVPTTSEKEERKSLSHETTFPSTNRSEDLRSICERLAAQVIEDWQNRNLKVQHSFFLIKKKKKCLLLTCDLGRPFAPSHSSSSQINLN